MRRCGPGKSLLVCMAASASVLIGRAAAHPGLNHDLHRATHAIEAAPRDPGLWVRRAVLHRLAGDLQASLDDLDAAAALGGTTPETRLERGLTLCAMGRDDEALAELDRGLADGGDSPAAYVARARLLAGAGLVEAALDDFDSALARRPIVDWYLERGRWLESQGRLAEAAEGYRDGLGCLGGAVLLRRALIRVESERNRPDAALALIDEALGDARVKTEWLLRRAAVLATAGREEAARQELGRALAEAERALARKPTPLNRRLRAKVLAAMDGTGSAWD